MHRAGKEATAFNLRVNQLLSTKVFCILEGEIS